MRRSVCIQPKSRQGWLRLEDVSSGQDQSAPKIVEASKWMVAQIGEDSIILGFQSSKAFNGKILTGPSNSYFRHHQMTTSKTTHRRNSLNHIFESFATFATSFGMGIYDIYIYTHPCDSTSRMKAANGFHRKATDLVRFSKIPSMAIRRCGNGGRQSSGREGAGRLSEGSLWKTWAEKRCKLRRAKQNVDYAFLMWWLSQSLFVGFFGVCLYIE